LPNPPFHLGRALIVLGFLAVLALRLHYCAAVPAETTDILRNVGYGRAFWSYGFRLYDMRPVDLEPASGWDGLWPQNVYDYPVATLLFFAFLAKVSTSLVVAKVVLSAIELGNSALVFRLTGSPLLALLYWASPASLWWVSHEGQFEPLVVGFALLALHSLRTGRTTSAYVWLAIAVQAKLFPILLLPYFAVRARSNRASLAFAVAFLPSLLALTGSRYITRMFAPDYWPSGFNPFAWNLADEAHHAWMPRPLVLACGALTYGCLLAAAGLLVRALWRRRPEAMPTAVGYLPLVLFLALLKSIGWAQFWYLLQIPVFVLAIEEARPQRFLLALALFEPRAAAALVVGPLGLWQWFPIDLYMKGGA
jgi:hypothetical protein